MSETGEDAILWQIEVANFMRRYPPLVILPVAIVGNTLSFLVLSRPSIASTSVSVYLRVLAVFDAMTVICGYLPAILATWASLDIIALATETCRAHRFFLFFSGDVAVWILGLLTLDRLIVVMVPLKAKTWCRRRRASLATFLLILLAIIKNMPIFFSREYWDNRSLNGTNETVLARKCVVKPSFVYYDSYVRPWISLVFYYLLPAVTILVSNILILWKMSRRMKKFSAGGMQATGGLQRSRKLTSAGTKKNDPGKGGQSRSLTLMVVSITILFFLCITPSMTIWTLMNQTVAVTPEDGATRGLLYSVTDVLVFTHHSINFILYTISGRRFRMELLSLLGCGRYARQRGIISSVSTMAARRTEDR